MTRRPYRSKAARWMRGAVFNHLPSMISCRRFEGFILDYLEGDLPRRQKKMFELHLMLCRDCRHYLVAYRETVDLGRRVGRSEPQPQADWMLEDLIDALRAAHAASSAAKHHHVDK